MNTNQGITALIVLFFVVLVGYWVVNSSTMPMVAQSVPASSQVAGVYNGYQAVAVAPAATTYPTPTYVAPAAPVYAYPAAAYPTYATAPVYSYPAYYPSYNTAPRTYITYPIARSTSYSSSYYSSPGYYNSYTTTTNPGGTYPGSGQNCYTQPNGSYTCTYQQQY